MKRHPFRWDALIFGVVFLAAVGMWLTQTMGWFTTDQLAYALAGTLIAVGVAGIMASLATPNQTERAEQEIRSEDSDAEEATDAQS